MPNSSEQTHTVTMQMECWSCWPTGALQFHQEEPGQFRSARHHVSSMDLQTSWPQNHRSQEILAPIGERKRDKSAVASGANLKLKQLHLERINNSVVGKEGACRFSFLEIRPEGCISAVFGEGTLQGEEIVEGM